MTKRCVICRKQNPNTLVRTCSYKCALEYLESDTGKKRAESERKRLERQKRKQEREAIKTRGEWLADAQKAFNRYIRLRDAGQPCISCGKATGCKMNAGHYRSVGAAPELRFNELNVHIQCERCNSHLSGNAIEYRIRLVEKIGQDKVEWLEGPHDPLNLTIDEIRDLAAAYRKKCRELERAG